jgi:hypothetical protein
MLSEKIFSSAAETDTTTLYQSHANRALQLLNLNFKKKKAQLNFMFEWQSPPIAEDEEDWLWGLAAASDKQRNSIWREISDSCEFAEAGYLEMPEKEDG